MSEAPAGHLRYHPEVGDRPPRAFAQRVERLTRLQRVARAAEAFAGGNATWATTADGYVLTLVDVPEGQKGQGIEAMLVRAALDQMRLHADRTKCPRRVSVAVGAVADGVSKEGVVPAEV